MRELVDAIVAALYAGHHWKPMHAAVKGCNESSCTATITRGSRARAESTRGLRYDMIIVRHARRRYSVTSWQYSLQRYVTPCVYSIRNYSASHFVHVYKGGALNSTGWSEDKRKKSLKLTFPQLLWCLLTQLRSNTSTHTRLLHALWAKKRKKRKKSEGKIANREAHLQNTHGIILEPLCSTLHGSLRTMKRFVFST